MDIATLDKIQHDYRNADDCLREMLSAWLKMIHPPPSWPKLADAVKHVDLASAEQIRKLYCYSIPSFTLEKPSHSRSCVIM